MGSGFLDLDYSATRNLTIGQRVSSDIFSAGGHLWKIICYPRGEKMEHRGEFVSIFLMLYNSANAKAPSSMYPC
jgi:speckle-type POZ protein